MQIQNDQGKKKANLGQRYLAWFPIRDCIDNYGNKSWKRIKERGRCKG